MYHADPMLNHLCAREKEWHLDILLRNKQMLLSISENI